MGLFSSRKTSVKMEAKFAEPPAAAPAPAAVAATSSDDLSLQKTEGFRAAALWPQNKTSRRRRSPT